MTPKSELEPQSQDEQKPTLGFILIHRQLRDHEYWADAHRLKAWLTILFMACYRPVRTMWQGQRMTIPRGSFITTSGLLAAEIGRSRSWVQRFLRAAESEGELKWTRLPGRAWGMITVVHYDDYQRPGGTRDARNDAPVTRSWCARDAQKKERKERKEETPNTTQADHVGSPSTGYPQEAVGRIFEAFQKASGAIRPPSAKEREHIREVVTAAGGDWHPLVDFVRDVTGAAVVDGEPIRSVSYALRVWQNRQAESASGARSPVPSGGTRKPAYRQSAKGRQRTRDVDESKHGAELVGRLLDRLRLHKKPKED